jgi:hypothetical protein
VSQLPTGRHPQEDPLRLGTGVIRGTRRRSGRNAPIPIAEANVSRFRPLGRERRAGRKGTRRPARPRWPRLPPRTACSRLASVAQVHGESEADVDNGDD